ncbi:flagellar hook-associated protein FlgK [Acetobacter pomorum]|uniref:Flagellar hook-associated protein 1 n=1 Tax=Acetobacter pomorum TaxID=65959 RepID=A0A2G4R8G5_9PROT|nr:flagellar hook-associated protein FlgK [Acetobacter pomorum]PHY92871.1 flagellar hook-associated protein FlgK [Acetobacter pomorum]GBR53210.1 flagellar hook-associated protein FlgK [Acetobacter pomorum DSM 11825]
MDLGLSLSIATSGLHGIDSELAVTSENVSNSGTAGYVKETAVVSSVVAGKVGTGVSVGNTTLSLSAGLQKALYSQNAKVSALTTMDNSLASLSAVQGTTTSDSTDTDTDDTTGTLSDSLQGVASAITSLSATPTSTAALSGVISDAETLTSQINTLSSVYDTQRQTAENNIASNVSDVNSSLTTIGEISKKIMLLTAAGQDTADLQNQRLEAMDTLSQKLDVTFNTSSNGDVTVHTTNGTLLPTRPDQIGLPDSNTELPSSSWPLTYAATTISSSMYYKEGDTSGGISGIMLNGQDVTSDLSGGSLGANITLRDRTYPKMQAQLDSFSYTLINRFDNAGTPLFTNGTSSSLSSDTTKTTPNGIVGLSSVISVNQDYVKNPSLLTTDSNGNTGVITGLTNILGEAFGTASDDTSGSLSSPSSGLGPSGDLATGYAGNQGLSELATSLTTDQAATISNTSADLSTESTVQTTLSTKVSSVSGVDVNSQMSEIVALQSAYTANAKIVTAVQSMFSELLDAVN